jgi:hypothetical protein
MISVIFVAKMAIRNTIAGITVRFSFLTLAISMLFIAIASCGDRPSGKSGPLNQQKSSEATDVNESVPEAQIENALLISPANPKPGDIFRVMAVGGKSIHQAKIVVNGAAGQLECRKSRKGDGLPYWRIDEFKAESTGKYQVILNTGNDQASHLEFLVSDKLPIQSSSMIWKTVRGWGKDTEALYSAWINALFQGTDERSSWGALHEVMQNGERNFLYNHLSFNEDDHAEKNSVIMRPDCADNPFYLRAYFAWKLGLPFGYHECDRGYLGRPPKTGRLITNESGSSKAQPVLAFNSFLRRVMDGVHSGTARTALLDENADYYPVPLTREALRPGVVFADPYGHTLILVGTIPQTGDHPGVLLSVDAQPDGTVGIKRFWKGNFLFNTTDVVGEPGFKTFRPILFKEGQFRWLKNQELSAESGMIPFSTQQKGMTSEIFYHTMERIINPKPLDPKAALLDLIQALHEQLLVRITSVANGEAYMKSHPGEVIPMPGSTAGVFQAGGQWEDFSTPNRDLRLLIAMDAVLDFPERIIRNPEDFKMPGFSSPEHVKKNLEEILAGKSAELSITYTRTNGVEQVLTMGEILKRRAAFEMAYNPNDGIEIRWGAPENSEERSTCHRHVSASQLEKMGAVRGWFRKRLHPPT